MTQPFLTGKKFAVIGGPNVSVPHEEHPSYGTWRVVRADNHEHLICAFYGGASLSAATIFFGSIEADPKWGIDS